LSRSTSWIKNDLDLAPTAGPLGIVDLDRNDRPLQAHLREHYPRVRDHAEMCRLFDASGAVMGRRLHAVVEPGG